MRTSQAFPGSYLKADDLGNARPIVIIRSVKMEDIGDDHKPVLYFEDKEKGLVLNKTNANMITEIAGTDEMDDWPGVTIRLYQTKVDFQGKRVPAIRVEAPPDTANEEEEPPPPPKPRKALTGTGAAKPSRAAFKDGTQLPDDPPF